MLLKVVVAIVDDGKVMWKIVKSKEPLRQSEKSVCESPAVTHAYLPPVYTPAILQKGKTEATKAWLTVTSQLISLS